MAKKKAEDTAYCVLTLPLLPEKWQIDVIETRFRIMEHLKNSLIALELRKLKNLQRTKAYRELEQAINEAKEKAKEADEEKPRKKGSRKRNDRKNELSLLYVQRREMLKNAGFSEFAFMNDMTPMQKHFKEHIGSHVAHSAASDVWRAFYKVLSGNGNTVHFQKQGTLVSIANKQFGTIMNYKNGKFIWTKLEIPVVQPRNAYEEEMLKKPIKYLRIVRKWMKTRYKYYLQFTLVGSPVMKDRIIGDGRVGIDIGPKTVAICSEQNARLLELADRINTKHRKKLEIMRKMDVSRRRTNPDNYQPNGVPKRGCKWIYSKHYLKLKGELREYERKMAAIRKYQHTCLANEILSTGTEIYVERMNFSGLQRRAKKTEKNEKGQFKKKKRFGKSLANKAPATLISLLKIKAEQYGGSVSEVETSSFRASQYDHTADTYQKKSLSQRFAYLSNGDCIQRDLYSAFLLMNAKNSLQETDRTLCFQNYDVFKLHHDEELNRIKRFANTPLPSSFGIAIVRSPS